MTSEERAADIAWMVETGETHVEAIARRAQLRPKSVATILRRAGRADLLPRLTGQHRRPNERPTT